MAELDKGCLVVLLLRTVRKRRLPMPLFWRMAANKQPTGTIDDPDSHSTTKKAKSPEIDFLEIIEIVAKDVQLKADKTNIYLEKLTDYFNDVMPTIQELKREIKSLKDELKEEKAFNRELITKLVDKPSAPSAAAAYLASKTTIPTTTSSPASGSNATAGPKGKLP